MNCNDTLQFAFIMCLLQKYGIIVFALYLLGWNNMLGLELLKTRFSKKAEITFNVIIVAIIALIVLFVIVSIFSSKTGSVSESLDNCITSGGSCVDKGNCDGFVSTKVTCPNEGQVCCKGLVRGTNTPLSSTTT